MTDYTELVKALRCCATMTCKGDECKYMILGCHDCFKKLHDDAAAAIEELQAQLPKRGEWKCSYPEIEPNPMFMYGICSICGFEQSISNQLNYCPNCGAKMEVQE